MSKLHRKALLTVFLVAPVIVMVLLLNWIASSLRDETIHKLPPIGAGAGDTGGANGLGEQIAQGIRNVPIATPQSLQADDEMVDPVTLEQGFYLVVTDKAAKANASSPMFFASNLTGWNPGDEKYKLTAQSDTRWRLHLVKPVVGNNAFEPIEFKFTRGSWELEELKADFTVPANRKLPKIAKSQIKPGEPPQIELTVEAWGDQRPDYVSRKATDPYHDLQVTGTVRRLQVQGGMGTSKGRNRDLLVWLPPGYDRNSDTTYPVLYMHDGQNVFENHPMIPQEWKLDEVAQDLVQTGKVKPFIIVAIPHSGSGRISEYMPVPALEGVTPEGEQHVQWLINTVMPRVASTFRVKHGPENTAIGGASLGAAISLFAATTHPEVFGSVIAESLPLTTGKEVAWQGYIAGVKQWPRRTFLGMGGMEFGKGDVARSEKLLKAVKDLESRIGSSAQQSVKLVISPDAVHNEKAWSERLPESLTFIFPPEASMTK